jgi:hypothetical protein
MSLHDALRPWTVGLMLVACARATVTGSALESCVEPQEQLAVSLALVASLQAQLEEAKRLVVANELLVRQCGPLRRAIAPDELTCDSSWKTHNAVVKCSALGGKSNVIEVADAGGWTHAYQEISVDPDATYNLSGEFYPLAFGECDGSAAVKWCSPSVVVCPGPYNGNYYNTGGCLVGLAPNGKDAWEPFKSTFTATGVRTVTVYINQQSTTFSSVISGLRVTLLQERSVHERMHRSHWVHPLVLGDGQCH